MGKKRFLVFAAAWLCLLIMFPAFPVATRAANAVKELNFVFLHGAGGDFCALQLASDMIREQAEPYIAVYEQANPGIKVVINVLLRCYPGDVDTETWAGNVGDDIATYFPGKKDLILVGHSMGGKAALYAVAHDIKGLRDKTSMVVTIDSPIRALGRYYVLAGGAVSAEQYCNLRWILSSRGVCASIANYDSSEDGKWVGLNKHWLAFIAAENAPLSPDINPGGLDGYPRDMDDGLVPISAQYTYGADVIYYGEHGHSEFEQRPEITRVLTNRILDYIFGGDIEVSVFERGGTFKHAANWLPLNEYWEDEVGDVNMGTGNVTHNNPSFFKWQEWEDVVEVKAVPNAIKSKFEVNRTSFALFTGVMETRWLKPDDPSDFRLYIRTRAAPRSGVQANWTVFHKGLLDNSILREHWEVRIITGSPLSGIPQVTWLTDDLRDVRLKVWSQTQGPFRAFEVEWKAFFRQVIQRNVINEIQASQ